MTKYLFDILIILVFLYFGIKYLKTKQFDDKKGIYTEESKEKAAKVTGILFIGEAIFWAVVTILKYKEIIHVSLDDGLIFYLIPYIIFIVVVTVVLVIVYATVLKKK